MTKMTKQRRNLFLIPAWDSKKDLSTLPVREKKERQFDVWHYADPGHDHYPNSFPVDCYPVLLYTRKYIKENNNVRIVDTFETGRMYDGIWQFDAPDVSEWYDVLKCSVLAWCYHMPEDPRPSKPLPPFPLLAYECSSLSKLERYGNITTGWCETFFDSNGNEYAILSSKGGDFND